MLTVDYDILDLRPGQLMLDLGCGFGRHAFEAFRRGGRVVACDMAVPELRECRALFEAMVLAGEADDDGMADATCGDATRLPFPDATFDRIIASEVMEHIPDDNAALTELVRVLKPGGRIAITVPAFLAETVCWQLSDEYYARSPRAAMCASTPSRCCARRWRAAGWSPTRRTRRTRCTPRTGGSSAPSAPATTTSPW
ncbi:MAG: class I SAM-dependent methyltransferase [Acidimicrobiales bacterium]